MLNEQATTAAPRLEWGIRHSQPEDHLYASVAQDGIYIDAQIFPSQTVGWSCHIWPGLHLYQPPAWDPPNAPDLYGIIEWAERHVERERARIQEHSERQQRRTQDTRKQGEAFLKDSPG